MAQSILQLKVDDKQYNSSLRSARQGLSALEESLRKCGGSFNTVDKDVLQYTQSLGRMTTTATTAKGKVGEMTTTFTELSTLYRRLTDEERNSPFGKALSQSLDQLKGRITESKKELADIQNELGGSKAGFSDFSSILGDLGGKLGINSDLMGLVTTGTIGMTAAIGAAATAVAYATEQWAEYNSELAKQDQVTTVTTGLKGEDMEALTNAARAMADVYGVDFRDVINAANTLMTQFGQSGAQATQLIRDGMQGMIQGDGPKLLSMIQQFAPAFRDAGISASQLVAIIHNSEGGIFTDQNMNAITMGIKNIRNMTDSTSEALQKLGISGSEMTQKLNDGTMTIFEALQIVASAIENVGSGSQAAGQVMQQVFGRQGAMAGTKLGEAIATLNTNLEETKNQTGAVGESLARLEQSHEQLEAAMRSAFGYKGWEEMSNSLKNDLYVSLANVVSGIDKVKSAMEAVYAPVMAVSDAMYGWLLNCIDKTEALKATIYSLTGPLGSVLYMLDAIGRLNLSNTAQDAYDKKIKEVEGQTKGSPGTFYVSNPEPGRAGNGFTPSVTTTASRTTGRTGGGRTGRTGTGGGRTGGRTGGTGSTTTSPADRAKAKYEQAEKDYNQALEQATMELNAGTINRAEAKKKELQATESLWKAIGDAQEIHNSPELKKAKEETEKKYTELSASLTAEVEAQKAADKAAKELEAAEKTLAKAQEALAEAKQTGDLGQVMSAEKKVSAAQTAVTNIKSPASSAMEVPITFNEKNLNTAIEALRSKIQEAPLNSDLLSRLTESLEDAENISAIISTAMNNGISLADFDGTSIINKILNAEDIDDATIENYVAQVNEKLKEKLGESEDIPEILITFDADTSKVVSASKKQREEAQKTVAGWNLATQSVNNLGTALSNLEDPGVKALGTVLKAIADIALGFAQAATAPDVTSSGWGWLVWLAAGTAAMATTIATVHSLTGFANGGIVPGNNMSGDNLHTSDYGINSGELILNRSQQNAIASQLSGGSLSNLHLESHVSGDDLVFVLNTNDSIWGRDNYIMNR